MSCRGKIWTLFFLAAFHAVADGQTRITESIKQRIAAAATNEEKLTAIFRLNDQAIDADSLLPYIEMAERIVAETGNKEDADNVAYYRAGYYTRKNHIDSALSIMERLVKDYRRQKKEQARYLTFLFFKAKVHDRANQYSEALSELYNVIAVAEEQRDTLIQIQAKTGIGWVLMEMTQYKEALQWLHKARSTATNKEYYKNYGALYSNLASAHNSVGHADSAIHYISIAINDARENENLLFLATALSMQAKIYIDSKQPLRAEAPLNEALAIRKKINDPFYIVYDMSNLASYYAGNGQTAKGIAVCEEGIRLAKANGLSSQLLLIFQALAENYKAAGNTEQYSKTLEQIIAIKDSFNSINSGKLLADLQANNETIKKEKRISEQQLDLVKKNYWLAGAVLFSVMAGAIAWLLFRNYRRRQQLKMEIALTEEKRMAGEAVAEAEEHERKRIAADLHDNLGVYAASMASNLSYIKPQDYDEGATTAFDELKNNSAAIISELNDTIWVLKKEVLSLTAISDRVKVFVGRIKRSFPDVSIEVEEEIETDPLFSSSQAFHLYRIIQEAVNNSLKHSKGKNIRIILQEHTYWQVAVTDDGQGIQQTTIPGQGGNGLQNMKNRAAEAGWTIEWLSSPGGGTTVKVTPTTN